MATDSGIWADEETESETDDDSWFYASVKKYKNLHMFDLQQATRIIEWIGNDTICVAGFESPDRNEIWELVVPERLLPTVNDEGLCKNRDFKMRSGGFTKRPVYHLKHIPTTTKIATCEGGQNSIHIYQLGGEKNDMIEHLDEIKNPITNHSDTPVLSLNDNGQMATFGSRLGDICLVDINTGKMNTQLQPSSTDSPTNSALISQLHLVRNNTVVACMKTTGQLRIFDIREPQSQVLKCDAQLETNSNEAEWTSAISESSWESTPGDGESVMGGGGKMSGNVIGCLSSMGHLIQFDLRNLKEISNATQLPHNTHKEGGAPFLSLQFAPNNRGIVSVSGFDGHVCIYDISPWCLLSGAGVLSPLFIHDGHSVGKKLSTTPPMVVTSHCWHPQLPNVVLSAGSDKSLHAWEWQVEIE